MSNPNLIFHDELISSQNTHPLLLNPPYQLTLPITELTTPKELKEPKEPRRRRGQKIDNDVDDKDLIPRPHNAFIIFRTDYAAKVRKDDKRISIRIISRMASKKWKTVPEMVKVFFKLLADMYQHRHKILFPNYKYAPKSKPSLDDSKKNRSSKEGKKKGQIITWYLHDNVEDFERRNINSDDLNNFAQMSLEDRSQNNNLQVVDSQQQTSAATFINYTAPPSISYPSLPSLTTINPNPTYHPIIDNNNNSLISNSLNSSPPSDNLFFWPGTHNNEDTGPSFELPGVLDFNGF